MKELVMLVGDDLTHVQGVHAVIDNFVKSKLLFKEINFTKVFGGSHTIDIENGGRIPMGANKGKISYKIKRMLRIFLRESLSSHFLPFALLKYYFNGIKPANKCVQRLRESGIEPDYIIHHGVLAAYTYFKHNPNGKAKNVLIIHAEDDEMTQFFGVYPAFKGFMKRKILTQRDSVYSKIDKVVYLSQKACDNSMLPTEKKCYIYNGIDDIPYVFSDIKEDKTYFVCVGSMSGWKGQELVNLALTKMGKEYLDKLHVYYVGDGPEKVNLEKQVNDAHLEKYVTFTGVRMDVPEILRNQDVFVMPSKSEGLSIASLEALRAGLFMLLTDTGGNREVMGEKGGYVVERNADDIKNKICRILDEKVISVEQKKWCRMHFLANFTTERFISNYEQMLLSL